MYRILGVDRKEYGPVEAEVVRQWIAQGRANERTQVQLEGSDEWKPLSDLPEFAAALAAGVQPALQGGQEVMPPRDPGASTSLATTSLVLGIASLVCLGLLAGIPAIVVGHIAVARIRRRPDRHAGKGKAIAGLTMGYLSLLTTLFWLSGVFLPAISGARERATSINCESNLKQIGLAALMWSNDHTNRFPSDFASMSNELSLPRILVCPGDTSRTPATSWTSLGSENVSYLYVNPGLTEKEAGSATILFACPIHGHQCLSDGSVLENPPE